VTLISDRRVANRLMSFIEHKENSFLFIAWGWSMEKHTVHLSDRCYVVQVYKLANNIWIADGELLGDRLRASGTTAGKALRAWRQAAEQKPCMSVNS
jgi:hypothetical protein